MVKFLKEHLEKSGCRIGDNFIRAVHCNKMASGFYVRGLGVINIIYYSWTSQYLLEVEMANFISAYCGLEEHFLLCSKYSLSIFCLGVGKFS